MKRWTSLAVCLGLVSLGYLIALVSQDTRAARAAATETHSMMLAHNVYFTLNQSTPEGRKKLIEACHKHLSGHPGTVFYAAGAPSDLDREVNVRDFDVGLHLVFKDRAAHDAYQTAEKHLKFIEENKADWKQVRVFDSDVEGVK